jgi:hypothetical protein
MTAEMIRRFSALLQLTEVRSVRCQGRVVTQMGNDARRILAFPFNITKM